jgi:hypothetical protein
MSTTEELLGRKSSGSGLETENTAVGIRHADHVATSTRKFGTNFADKRRSLARYSSLADSGHGVCLFGYYLNLDVQSCVKPQRSADQKLVLSRKVFMNHFPVHSWNTHVMQVQYRYNELSYLYRLFWECRFIFAQRSCTEMLMGTFFTLHERAVWC